MAWTAPLTWTPNQVLTAAQLNTHIRDNMLETEAAKATGGGGYFVATGANAIAERQAQHNETLGSSTTTSTTYTTTLADGIATSVTVNHGPQALILWSANIQENTAADLAMMSVSWSGTSTGAASDAYAVYRKLQNRASYPQQLMHHLWVTGMSSGTSTFTLNYKVPAGGTGTFASRRIAVFPY